MALTIVVVVVIILACLGIIAHLTMDHAWWHTALIGASVVLGVSAAGWALYAGQKNGGRKNDVEEFSS